MFNHSAVRSWLALRALPVALLVGCASLQPVAPTTHVGQHSASGSVLALPSACTMSASDAVPMGRPDGTQGQLLPPGRYVPSFEDQRGVFFASPTGVSVTEPAPLGTRARAGGIYVPKEPSEGAWAYLGDAERVTERQRLPERCRYSLEPASTPAPPG